MSARSRALSPVSDRSRLGRLPGRDFDRVFKKGKRFSNRGIVLIASRAEDVSSDSNPRVVRLGIMVGRVVFKNAVSRNRLRRMLRESFRLCAARAQSRPAFSTDCVLLARESARSFQTRREVDGVVEKLIKDAVYV